MSTETKPALPLTVNTSDDVDVGSPISELQPPSTERALERLRERLLEFGMTAPGAAAVARAVNDPAAVRRRIGATPSGDSPGIISLRVPGGRLLAFNAEVNAFAIAGWPVNPRQASRLRYPIEEAPGTSEATRYQPLTEIVSCDDANELLLRVEDHAHAIWAYDRLTEYLKELNDLAPRIAKETVISPIVLAPVMISASAEEDATTILTAVDGSSRVTAAQRILGVTGADVLFGFPHNRRALNDHTARVRRVYGLSEIEVTEDEVAKARVLNIPAFVIVGFEPEASSDVDFATAVRSYIGLTHVDPPKPWDDAGTLDTYAAAVLDALRADDRISDNDHDYLAGLIPTDQLKERGFSANLDTRAAKLVHLATRPRSVIYQLTGQAIRRVSRKSQARQELRLAVFCELVLRSMRAKTLGGGTITGIRSTLQRTYSLAELGQDWRPTKRAPKAILEAALDELNEGKPGPSARELAVRGAYWLVGYGILARESAGIQEPGKRETRRPSTILGILMRSEHGLRILHRAIVDGRNGRRPRIVDSDGVILRDASGIEEAAMTVDWLRRVFPADKDGAVGASDNAVETPTAKLERHRRAVSGTVDALGQAMDALREVASVSGAPLVEEEGMPPAEIEDLRSKLRTIDDQLVIYQRARERRYPPIDPDDHRDPVEEVDE